MNLNQNKCINSNTASYMTVKVAKPIKNGRKLGRLRLIKVHFFEMPIKTLVSLGKIRVGRVTGNTHIFFFGLTHNQKASLQEVACFLTTTQIRS